MEMMWPCGCVSRQALAASAELKKCTRLQNSPRVLQDSVEQLGTTIETTAPAGSRFKSWVGVTVSRITVPVAGQGDSTWAVCLSNTGYIKVSSAHHANKA